MPLFKNIYFLGVILITVSVVIFYILGAMDHNHEIEKIKLLEDKYREINNYRSKSTACPIPGLDDPKKCYFNSNYTCSWNEDARRCDLK